MKVLFVDDYTESSEALADLAIALGHDARTAETAGGAMDAAVTWGPDLIVMDVKLGADDGRDVCRAMRREPRLAHCRIVALSGGTSRDVACEEGLFNGALTKPIDMQTLIRLFEDKAAPE